MNTSQYTKLMWSICDSRCYKSLLMCATLPACSWNNSKRWIISLEKHWHTCIRSCTTRFQEMRKCGLSMNEVLRDQVSTLETGKSTSKTGTADCKECVNEQATTCYYGRQWCFGVARKGEHCVGCLSRMAIGYTKPEDEGRGLERLRQSGGGYFLTGNRAFHEGSTKVSRLERG